LVGYIVFVYDNPIENKEIVGYLHRAVTRKHVNQKKENVEGIRPVLAF